MKRAGRVPSTVEDALALANNLPIPERLTIGMSNEEVRIRQYCYPPLDSGNIRIVDGDDSVFLAEEDRRLRALCVAERELVQVPDGGLTPAPSWWRNPAGPRRWPTTALDPFDRDALPQAALDMLQETLEASRNSYRDNRSRLSFRQAVRNAVMAFNLKTSPTPQELRLFFPSIWPSDDLIISGHFDALSRKLETTVCGDWLAPLICPRLAYVRSLPEVQQADNAQLLGIYSGGQINTGLVWAARGYFLDEVRIAAVDVEQVFSSDPISGRCLRLTPLPNGLTHPNFISFSSELREVLRGAINAVRIDLGLLRIGEGWLSETDLFRRIQNLLPGEEVIHHGRPSAPSRSY
jgi:hypothetical protein